ncbi:MAG: insulinase family protein, partial [Armatimonadetes bacterium]|nr:insulinase family protein [Armatimonadota bacterium]
LIYTLLGEGDESWLTSTLVEDKHLAIGATCDFLTQRYPGLFIISAICAPNKELPLRQAILDKLQELRSRRLTKEELDVIKRRLYTSFAFTNETFLDQVGSIGFYAMIDNYRFAFDYTDLVRSITPEEIQAVARRYLDPDHHSVVIVRPTRSQGHTEAYLPWPLG